MEIIGTTRMKGLTSEFGGDVDFENLLDNNYFQFQIDQNEKYSASSQEQTLINDSEYSILQTHEKETTEKYLKIC